MKKFMGVVLTVLFAATFLVAQGPSDAWRTATQTELKAVIPARAQVEKERIETEFRTASGIVDSKGRNIAGVVLITAGYSADGKYSNLFITQVPVKIGDMSLAAGNYVFGWHRVNNDNLAVAFYDAASGRPVGTVEAQRDDTHRMIQSFQILPPSDKPLILIGRFAMKYTIVKR